MVITWTHPYLELPTISSSFFSCSPSLPPLLYASVSVRVQSMANSALISMRILFLLLGSAMVATLVYTISIDGLPFRRELLTPWMVATLVDFYINVAALAAWVFYKESNWIAATIWIVFLVCFGSITTCGYILWQLVQLSSQESFQDIMYHVLIKSSNKNDMEQHTKQSDVMIARIIFGALGCLMLGTLVYTLLTDGSPFRKELLTPWMVATLIDFYINVTSLSVWVFYKESWLASILWIVLLISFGSITTCAYIVKELFKLTSKDRAYFILLNSCNRAERRYEITSFGEATAEAMVL